MSYEENRDDAIMNKERFYSCSNKFGINLKLKLGDEGRYYNSKTINSSDQNHKTVLVLRFASNYTVVLINVCSCLRGKSIEQLGRQIDFFFAV